MAETVITPTAASPPPPPPPLQLPQPASPSPPLPSSPFSNPDPVYLEAESVADSVPAFAPPAPPPPPSPPPPPAQPVHKRTTILFDASTMERQNTGGKVRIRQRS